MIKLNERYHVFVSFVIFELEAYMYDVNLVWINCYYSIMKCAVPGSTAIIEEEQFYKSNFNKITRIFVYSF